MHTRKQDKKEGSRKLYWDMIYNTISYYVVFSVQSMDQSWTEEGGLYNEVDFKMSPE